jgi:multidrug efflux pump subunit AcrA (membrane-fusion protein)
MVAMAKSWAQQWGVNAGIALTILLLIANLAKEWGGFGRDSEQQRELVATVAMLREGMLAEQEARKLLEQTVASNTARATERVARRDAEMAAANGRLSTVEGKLAAIQIDLAAKLAEISADVRAIKDRLGNRAAVVVPERQG